MKKFLLFDIIVFTFCFNLTAQSRIGYTESQIRSEFSSKTFTSSTVIDHKVINWQDEDMSVDYFFDDSGICKLCFVTPARQSYLNYMVEKFNKNYVIISDKKWKMYNNNGIIDIELCFSDGGGYYFVMK